MKRSDNSSRAGAVAAAILFLAAALALSGNLFAATHTTLAESGSSTT